MNNFEGAERTRNESFDSRENCSLFNIRGFGFEELMRIAPTSTHCRQQANRIFQRNYGKMRIEISDNARSGSTINDTLYVTSKSAIEFLSNFGHSTEKLTLNFSSIADHQPIGNLISSQCSDSLVELNVEHFRSGAFSGISKPFRKVENLVFAEGAPSNMKDKKVDLNKMFPEVRRLKVHTFMDGSIFDRSFPHLTEFQANVFFAEDCSRSTFLQSNPQITNLNVKGDELEFIQAVHDNMQNLQVFTLHVSFEFKTYRGPKFHFDSMKELTIRNIWQSFDPDIFEFKQLNKLKVQSTGMIDDMWIKFIKNNKHIQVLDLSTTKINDTALQKLSTISTNLVNASMLCQEDITADSVITFLSSNKHMNSLTMAFLTADSYDAVIHRIRVRLADNDTSWEINSNESKAYFHILKSNRTAGGLNILDLNNSSQRLSMDIASAILMLVFGNVMKFMQNS